MPVLDPSVASQFQSRSGVEGQVLLWITARDYATGAATSFGLWTGDDHQTFTIKGQARTYFGAGSVIDVPPVRSVVGVKTIYHSVTLPPFTPEVRSILQGYDPRLAKVELHSAQFDILTGNLMAEPLRVIKGTLQEAPRTLGAQSTTTSKTVLKIASNARRLSMGLPIYKAQAALEAAYPGDKGREFAAVAGDWVVPWGEA